MPHLEKYSRQDITDRSQASSSRSGSPEKLQQLRRAHGFQSEQKSNRKGIMSAEVQDQSNQAKQEVWDNNNRAAIDEIIKQRGGITSPQSEIRLGYQEGLQGGAYEITPANFSHVLRNDMLSHYRVLDIDLQRSVNRLIQNFDRLGGDTCIKPMLENWKVEGSPQKKKFAEIMLD